MLFLILQYDLTLYAPVFKYHLCIHHALMVTLKFFHWITREKLRCIWILIGQSYYEITKHLLLVTSVSVQSDEQNSHSVFNFSQFS